MIYAILGFGVVMIYVAYALLAVAGRSDREIRRMMDERRQAEAEAERQVERERKVA